MLLASEVGNKELQKPTFHLRKNIVVVSTASYRCMCPEAADEDAKSSGSRTPATEPTSVSLEDVDEVTNVMLMWLAVSEKSSPMPSFSTSWSAQTEINEGLSHWSATFMFNAASIFKNIEATDKTSNSGTLLRLCFFRYWSLRNDGTCKVTLDRGVVWFLNLCASYKKHMSGVYF